MSDTYRILLKNCSFYAFHGVFPEEKQNGQRFYIDAELLIRCIEPLEKDELDNVVHYGHVFEDIEACVKERSFDLIEALAAHIGQSLCRKFPQIETAMISVRKPDAPIDGAFDYVEVSVETRNS